MTTKDVFTVVKLILIHQPVSFNRIRKGYCAVINFLIKLGSWSFPCNTITHSMTEKNWIKCAVERLSKLDWNLRLVLKWSFHLQSSSRKRNLLNFHSKCSWWERSFRQTCALKKSIFLLSVSCTERRSCYKGSFSSSDSSSLLNFHLVQTREVCERGRDKGHKFQFDSVAKLFTFMLLFVSGTFQLKPHLCAVDVCGGKFAINARKSFLLKLKHSGY